MVAWKTPRLVIVLALALTVPAACGSTNHASNRQASETRSVTARPTKTTQSQAATVTPSPTPTPPSPPRPSSTPTSPARPVSTPAPSPPASPAASPTRPGPLVLRRATGYTVRLPSSWKLQVHRAPAAVLDDWFNPATPRQKLEVYISPAVGATKNPQTGQLDVKHLVPKGASSDIINPWKAAFQRSSQGDPYPDNGIVIITPPGSARPNGYIQVDLWLPAADHGLATQILNSFAPG